MNGRRPEPRDFGRDGVSGLVTTQRAVRARDISRPSEEQIRQAQTVAQAMIRRARGRQGA